jgi:hypothetical protein
VRGEASANVDKHGFKLDMGDVVSTREVTSDVRDVTVFREKFSSTMKKTYTSVESDDEFGDDVDD